MVSANLTFVAVCPDDVEGPVLGPQSVMCTLNCKRLSLFHRRMLRTSAWLFFVVLQHVSLLCRYCRHGLNCQGQHAQR